MLFKNALKYADYVVAKQALYEMITLAPENKMLKDTLAIVYFKIEAYAQCILLTREILEEDPSKNSMLEIKAISEQNIGLIKEALEDYETLFKSSKDVYHLYQVATLQYQLKRFGECNATVGAIIQNEDAKSKKVSIFDQQNRQQQVPLDAAAYNLLGVMALDTNDEPKAKEFFTKAVELFPEFALAKNNITIIDAKAKQEKK